MKKKPIIIALIALVVVALIAVVLKRFGIGEGEKKSGPIARVQVAKVQRKVISEKAIVFGSVVAQPGKTHSVSVAFETRVRHICAGERSVNGDRAESGGAIANATSEKCE